MNDNRHTDETVIPAPVEDAGPVVFAWADGAGRSWRIEASPRCLTLSDEEDHFDFVREAWRGAITFSPSGTRVVIHFDTGSREIGFLVDQSEARALFVALGQRDPARPAPSDRVEGSASADRGSALWPKMTAMPVVALCLSTLAFLPVVGFPIGLAAAVLALLARKRCPSSASYAHVRIVARIAIVFSIVGLGVCALGTYSFLEHASEIDLDAQLFGQPVEWSTGAVVAAIVMVIIALSFHEAGHAVTAWWNGDDCARSLGRVTLNPLAHIDLFGTVLLPLMLAMAKVPIFGYAKPVPVRLGHVRRWRRAHILISAAGPLSNLLQAAVCLELLVLMGSILSLAGVEAAVTNYSSLQPIVEIKGIPGGGLLAGIALMLKLGFQVNIMLAFFNMLPIPPLDGSWIAEHLAPAAIGQFYVKIRPFGFFIFIGLLYTHVLDYLLAPAFYVLTIGHVLIATVTGL